MFFRLKKYYLFIILALIGSLIEGITYSGLTFILKNVIDKIFIEKNIEKLKLIIVALIAIVIFRQLGIFLKEFSFPYASYRFLLELRKELFEKIIDAEPMYIYKKNLGDIISRVTNDINALRDSLQLIGVDLVSQIFTVIIMIGVLIYLDWQLFLLILLVVPLLGISLSFFGKLREKYSKQLQEALASYTQFISQIIQGFEVIKLFDKTFIRKEFEKVNLDVFRKQVKSILNDAFYLSSIEIASYIGIITVVGFGGYRIIKGELTTGEFFAFIGALLILVNSAQIMQRGLMQLKIVSPIVERIQEILTLPEEKKDGTEFSGLKEKIKYKDVSLSIDGNQILKHINFEIKKQEKVGIVGLSGSGKSTLVKLIPALIKNFEGKLLIDSKDVREYNVSSLRKYIGIVSQEVFIFNDTLRNNLLIAKPDATDEELIQALKKAKADFVFKLENGLDTVLGEKGSRLSGGERQRISIARLFLKNPDIIIIDEGTSALDVETEEYIMEELKKEFSDRTIIVITHRLKLLEMVNKVAVMENGQIVEQGSVDELLNRRGVFYRFYTLSSS